MLRKTGFAFSGLVALALAATVSACVMSEDDDFDDSTFTIVNDSSYVLTEVHVAEVDSRTWGPNLLPDFLYPGEELVVTDIECGSYDVMVTDETGVDCVLGNVELCFDDDAWVITDFTLDVCAFAG